MFGLFTSKMIAIVMTYFDRQRQLDKTLDSFLRYNPKDFRVVIVDDASPRDINLKKYPFEITILKLKEKKWTNPEPVYNTGIKYALIKNPEIIILQNAECYHFGDVIGYAKTVNQDSYISFGCYSIDEKNTFSDHDINKIIESNNIGIIANGTNGWYNHPTHRPNGFEFCSAITSANIRKLNGYDERFSLGCWYGDDYLIARIKILGLKIEITENPFVIHQWHQNYQAFPNAAALIEKNRILFNELVLQNNYRAEHLFTLDL
jgi:glycosyltransferase involved in cell wall biosynthesis